MLALAVSLAAQGTPSPARPPEFEPPEVRRLTA
jgi:hypothetical protein